MQSRLVLDPAARDAPFAGAAGIFVPIQHAQKRHGLIFGIDVSVPERPGATRPVRTVDIDLGVRAVMCVENVFVTTRGSIKRREIFPALEDADVPHVDEHFPVREATAGGFRVLPIAGIEITRLEPTNRLDVFETLDAARQIRCRHRCRVHAPTMRQQPLEYKPDRGRYLFRKEQ